MELNPKRIDLDYCHHNPQNTHNSKKEKEYPDVINLLYLYIDTDIDICTAKHYVVHLHL